MKKYFTDLPYSIQEKLIERFDRYNISAQEFYETPGKFPQDFTNLSEYEMHMYLNSKHLSHINPQSLYPQQASDIDNIILEDGKENMARSNNIMTDSEKQNALRDNQEDIYDKDFDDDGIIDIEDELLNADSDGAISEIVGTVLPIGLVLSGIAVFKKIKANEITIYDAPKEIIEYKNGKPIKLMLIGASGAGPILVASSVSKILYKNKNMIKKKYNSIRENIFNEQNKQRLYKINSFITSNFLQKINNFKNFFKK
jgi:hypothetical protein